MAEIDWSSILKKAQTYFDSPAAEKKKSEIVDKVMLGKVTLASDGSFASNKRNVHTVEDAAFKFMGVLYRTMLSHVGSDFAGGEFSELAFEVMEGLDCGSPYKIDDNLYTIYIYFTNDERHRESLEPEKYDGIHNIIALLNSGYDASGSVRGVWKNHRGASTVDEMGNPKEISSLPHRQGAHFLEQARDDFLGNYGTEYNITDITFDPEYNIRDL